MADATTTFSPDFTRAVLDSACRESGLDSAGATLLRFGENAIYRLGVTPVVVRVGRSVEASRKEAHVATWLASHHFPAARLANVHQPQVVDDTPVTFWELIEERSDPVKSADLGAVLRSLHELPGPRDFALPQFEPMPKVTTRLTNVGPDLMDADRQFLEARRSELERQFARLDFQLGCGPVHGDAHAANVMRDVNGTLRLIDFEDFCWGPREWDVCVEAVRYQAFGWVTAEDYAEFVTAYGFDPLKWSGFPVIRAMRELNMTTWLAQQAGHSAEIDEEIRTRIADLRDQQAPRRWRAF